MTDRTDAWLGIALAVAMLFYALSAITAELHAIAAHTADIAAELHKMEMP